MAQTPGLATTKGWTFLPYHSNVAALFPTLSLPFIIQKHTLTISSMASLKGPGEAQVHDGNPAVPNPFHFVAG